MSEVIQRRPGASVQTISVGIATLVIGIFVSAQAPTNPDGDSLADLTERLLPSVVNVFTKQTVRRSDLPALPPGSPAEELNRDKLEHQSRPSDASPRRTTSLGSGFLIDSSGYIVTNNHVIEGASEVSVTLF